MNNRHSRREKVCIFIDNNAFSEALDGRKVNFRMLRDWLLDEREASVLRFYCGETNRNESTYRSELYDCIRRVGFDILVSKITRSRASKPELDDDIAHSIACDIVWDMCELLQSGYYDSFILVTGSYEMANVVSRIRQKGIDVEVAFVSDLCSPALRGKATRFRELDFELVGQPARRSQRENVFT